jgi:hypothetical protein
MRACCGAGGKSCTAPLEAIEALEGASAGEHAAILAYHYAHSLHRDRAVKYSLLAGDEAMRLHAPAEAAISYDQALTLARGLPDTPESRRLQIDAILKLAAVGRSREDLARDQANLARGMARAHPFATSRSRGAWLIGSQPASVMIAVSPSDMLNPVSLLSRIMCRKNNMFGASTCGSPA